MNEKSEIEHEHDNAGFKLTAIALTTENIYLCWFARIFLFVGYKLATFCESATVPISISSLVATSACGAMIVAEIGDFSRFSSPDKILAFAGCSPSTYQSGQLYSSYYRVVVINVPLQGQYATMFRMLWIGFSFLPHDGSWEAPTTALCIIVNQLDTA